MANASPPRRLERLAPAKINLGLHILRRRDDGYHDLETVFLHIGWADTVRVAPADTLVFTCSDASLPVDASNLCVRAALRLAEHAGIPPAAHIHLEKQVPYGAGLGGGSSDAASTLILLDALWKTRLSAESLHELAAGLGSDVPCFLGPTAQLGTGRGERLTPLEAYHFPFTLVVVKPAVAVSTADAYRWITPRDAGRPDLRALVTSNDLDRWRRALVNDFEAPVFTHHPELQVLQLGLLEAGAGYAALSGSGSAVFGVFDDARAAQAAADALAQAGLRCWCGGGYSSSSAGGM